MSLLIKRNTDFKSEICLRFKGEIEFWGDGQKKVITFDEKIDSVFLPPTPFKLHLVTFQADEIERIETGRGRFILTVEGDLAQYLEREPNSSLCVSFIDDK